MGQLRGQSFTGLANLFTRVPETAANPATATFPGSGSNTNTWTYTASASQLGQLTITGNPVLTNDSIYSLYQFYAKDSDFLRYYEPKKGEDVHLLRHKWIGTKWQAFWIPCRRRADFFDLYLKTTVLRQKAASVPNYIDTTVQAIVPSDSGKPYTSVSDSLSSTVVSVIPSHDGGPMFEKHTDAAGETSYAINVKLHDSKQLFGYEMIANLYTGQSCEYTLFPEDARKDIATSTITLTVRKSSDAAIAGLVSGLPGKAITLKWVQTYAVMISLADQVTNDRGTATILTGTMFRAPYEPNPKVAIGAMTNQVLLLLYPTTVHVDDIDKFVAKSIVAQKIRLSGADYFYVKIPAAGPNSQLDSLIHQQELNRLDLINR